MKLIIVENAEELSKVSAEIMLGVMHGKGRINIAPTTGTTPLTLYEAVKDRIRDKPYFEHVHYYNFDETPFKISEREGRIITKLREIFFMPAGISEENIHPLTVDNFTTRDAELSAMGGLDLVLLGLGADGHFCCNFPGYAKFSQHTVQIPIQGKLRELYKTIYTDKNEIPDHLITMGPSAILSAKQLLLMISGKEKAEIAKRAIFGEIAESVPGSILRTHPNITVVVDKEAACFF